LRYGQLSLLILFTSVLINIIGAYIESIFLFPVYLDSIGTILSAVLLGPHIGAIVGFATNMINGYLIAGEHVLFAPVNVFIGLVTGVILYDKKIELKTVLYALAVVTVIGAIVGNLISIYFFAGITEGGVGHITQTLQAFVESIPTSAFLAGVYTNLLDKVISFAAVFAGIYAFKKQLLPIGLKL